LLKFSENAKGEKNRQLTIKQKTPEYKLNLKIIVFVLSGGKNWSAVETTAC
jgi:hypothetical protein